jgi:hypothetical protein
MKFFVQRYVSSTTTFTTRVQNKLVVGLATWREQREVGRRTFEAALVVDVFSNKGVQVVKEIVKTALLAEKLVATIHIDDPVARKPQDKPPDEAVLEVHEDVDEERVGDALLLTGDTTFLEEKLLLIGGSEYDIDADVYRFPLSDDVTKDYLIENLQSLVDLAGYSLKVFVCSTCTHKLQESHRVPCANPLSCTELIELEQEQHAELQKGAQRANEHAKQKAHWEAAMYEIELETQLPVLSVLRVLQAFASMGPTVDLKAELSRLLTDSMYWYTWCAQSNCWLQD